MYASVEKVQEGFEAVGKRFDATDNLIQETAQVVKALKDQLRRLRTEGFNVGKACPEGSFWQTYEDAKRFGTLVMASLGCKFSGEAGKLVEKAQSEGSNIGGGYLVPDEMSQRWIDLLSVYGKFRQNATVLPMDGAKVVVPKLTSDLTVYCPGEGGEVSDSDVAFGQIALSPKTWAALAYVSHELDEDSIVAVGEIVARSISRSMAKMEDVVGFLGDGTSTYFGMTGIAGTFQKMIDASITPAGVVPGSGNAYSELVLADFRDMVARLPEEYDESAVWVCSKKFYYNVMWKLAEAAGVANMFELLSDRKSRYFLQYPVVFSSVMPVAEANGQLCCFLGDLRNGAYLGQRRGFTVSQSDHVRFTKGQKAIMGSERIDINVFGCGDAAKAGSIIALRTAAA